MKRIRFSVLMLLIFAISFNIQSIRAAESNNLNEDNPTSVNEAVIKVGANTYTTFEEAIANAETGSTVTLVKGPVTVDKSIKITGDKNLTIDLNGNTVVFARSNSQQGSLFHVSSNGSFTLKNGKLLAQNKENEDFTGNAIFTSKSNLTVDSIEASGFRSNSEGGVIHATDDSQEIKINISNCNFHDNSARDAGGAIFVSATNQGTQTIIQNNKVSNNIVSGEQYSRGGGIAFASKGYLELRGNMISNNASTVEEMLYGSYWSQGGGVDISGDINAKGNVNVKLVDNVIDSNQTQLFGGGLALGLDKRQNDTISIESGVFSNNYSGVAGGAIDYSVHGQPILKLENFIMTGNSALVGGGIWACPTAEMDSYSTLGGVIVGNELSTTGWNYFYPKEAHDIAFFGSDTRRTELLEGNDPAIHRVTVVDRTFLGDKVDWYADEAGDLYEEGDKPLSPEEYTDKSTSFSLLGKIDAEDWLSRHKSEAKLIFINNIAGVRGGAISTNSAVQIGEPGDIDLKVTKNWLDRDGNRLSNNLPETATITLVRVDETGAEYELDKVNLNEDNNWQYTFTNLPSKGLVNGEIQKFTYTVKEATVEGYETEVVKSGENEILIKNKQMPITTTSTTVSTTTTDSSTTSTSSTKATTITGSTVAKTTATTTTEKDKPVKTGANEIVFVMGVGVLAIAATVVIIRKNIEES